MCNHNFVLVDTDLIISEDRSNDQCSDYVKTLTDHFTCPLCALTKQVQRKKTRVYHLYRNDRPGYNSRTEREMD